MDISKLRSDKGDVAVNGANGRAQSTQSTRGKNVDGTEQGQGARATKTLGGTDGAEKVKWSPDAELAQEALGIAKDTPVSSARAEKIAALKASVKNGTYQVDAHKVADRMIQEAMEEDLLTRKS